MAGLDGYPGQAPPLHPATVTAIAVVVYAFSSLLHEGVGHGGACLLVGGVPRLLSSMDFRADTTGLASWAQRWISAGGTLANLIVGLVAMAALHRARGMSSHLRYFGWLLATVNLLQGTGYLLFSGVANIGDWAAVIRGGQPEWAWRLALAIGGGAGYYLALYVALMRLGPFVGAHPRERLRRALVLTLVPYVTGAALFAVAGMFHPGGTALLVVSGLAASLGGTSGLAWGAQLFRGETIPATVEAPLPLPCHPGWIAAAMVIAIPFVLLLGRGIPLE